MAWKSPRTFLAKGITCRNTQSCWSAVAAFAICRACATTLSGAYWTLRACKIASRRARSTARRRAADKLRFAENGQGAAASRCGNLKCGGRFQTCCEPRSMLELQLCLNFFCCKCEEAIEVVVQCSGKGLEAGPRTVA